jgi:hypothetical protein
MSRFCSHKDSNSGNITSNFLKLPLLRKEKGSSDLKLPLLIKEKDSNDLQGSQEHQKVGVILFERNLFSIQNTKAKYELNPFNDYDIDHLSSISIMTPSIITTTFEVLENGFLSTFLFQKLFCRKYIKSLSNRFLVHR